MEMYFIIKKYGDWYSDSEMKDIYFSKNGINWEHINPYKEIDCNNIKDIRSEEVTYYNGKFVLWSSRSGILIDICKWRRLDCRENK